MDRSEVCGQLGVQDLANPGKYLGMPLWIGSKKRSAFAFLVESGTETTNMELNSSKAGKVTLLKTTTQSIPKFWMSLLLIPVGVCESIERKMNA